MPTPSNDFLRRSTFAAIFILTGALAPLPLLAQTPPRAEPAAPEAQPAAAAAELYKAADGPFTVKAIDETWRDEARKRDVPVRIYLPEAPAQSKSDTKADPAARFPVIVFSPGLGGSRIIYGYFGRHMASHGFIVITVTHAGSDTAAAIAFVRGQAARNGGDKPKDADTKAKSEEGWLMSSISDPDNLRDRPRDISFVIDQIATHKILGTIADMQRIGVAGHSFGAYTAMAVGGMLVDLPASHGGKAQSFRDPRVKAVLPMSPEGAGAMGITSGAWEKFGAPVLFLTGTLDYGAGGRSAAWRTQAFDAVHTVDDYLVTISGAGHMTFSNPGGRAGAGGAGGLGDGGGIGLGALRERAGGGGGGGGGVAGKAAEANLINSLSTAFFDAYVRDDAKAREWLRVFCMKKRSDFVAQFKPATK